MQGERRWRLENESDEPRWTIAKWDAERCFIEGPVILPVDDGLTGLEWVEAATVEVVPLATPTEHGERRYTLIEHEACGYRWWSEVGRLQRFGPCVSCGVEQPEWLCIPAVPAEELRNAEARITRARELVAELRQEVQGVEP